jgi:formylglycine-generating enzyme required for sulfatase activity
MPRARWPPAVFAALSAATASSACSVLLGIDSRDYVDASGADASNGPDGNVADDAANDAGAELDASSCPGMGGPRGIRIDGGGVSFCIDATEVTRGDYARFLAAASVDVLGAQPRCAWKTSFQPATGWPPQLSEESLPVVWVDWCDAYAFCAWAGKQLCGRVGGGPLTGADPVDPARSQWMYACTAAGTRPYAYGGSYDPTRCNTNGKTLVDAGSLPVCVGGFSGIFDLSGNAEEWEDNCDLGDAGQNDVCRLRGGSFNDGNYPGNYACAIPGPSYSVSRSLRSLDVGFRCCSP